MIDVARAIRSSLMRVVPLIAFTIVSVPHTGSAQTATKKVLSVDDYTKWKSIGNQSISGDGKWVAYVLSATNTAPADAKPVLHLVRLDNNQDLEIANATAPAFSPDSKWLAYTVDASGGGRGGRGGRGGGGGGGGQAAACDGAGRSRRRGRGSDTAAARRVEESRNWHRAVVAGHPVVHFRRDVEPHRAAPASARSAGRRGGWARRQRGGAWRRRAAVRRAAERTRSRLARAARTSSFTISRPGAISCSAASAKSRFNKKGDLLAYTVDGAVRDGNGLFILDLRNGRISTLDNDARVYSRLTWNDEGTGLAVLKGVDVDKMRERDNVLLGVSERAVGARRNRVRAGRSSIRRRPTDFRRDGC